MTGDKDISELPHSVIIVGESNLVTQKLKDDLNINTGGLIGGDYYLGVAGNRIWLTGKTAYAVTSIADVFISELKAALTLGNKEITVSSQTDTKIDIMSFNIWTTKPDDARVERVISAMTQYMPDIIGLQEASPYWMTVLKNGMPSDYAFIGEGRDGGNKGEYNPVFYLKNKYKLIESGTRWLSATPNVPSKFSESSLNRIFTYAIFETKKDGTKFMFINTHLEHTSADARIKQIEVLLNFIKNYPDLPTCYDRDFNAQKISDEYRKIINAGFLDCGTSADTKINAGPTFPSKNYIIDFCFVSGDKFIIDKYLVFNEKVNGEYPSDHFPIYAEIKFANQK